MSRPFQFKHFILHQDKAAMKVGTDAMLLGAMVPCESALRILDIGTGTGVLALMLAQRCDATIDAIDIDSGASEQAADNFKNSPWNERLAAYHTSLQDYAANTEKTYDLIISNPPYFHAHHSLKSSPASIDRKRARQTSELTLGELAGTAGKLLTHEGSLYLILPPERMEEFIGYAVTSGLFCEEEIHIKSQPKSEVIRVIGKFSFSGKKKSPREFIIYQDQGGYTKEYIELTRTYHAVDLG
jgi:tRNA1Val (adenine37-N6)-methyltransferase